MRIFRNLRGFWRRYGTSEKLNFITFILCVVIGIFGLWGSFSVGIPSISLMLLGTLALAFLIDQGDSRKFRSRVTSLLQYDRLGKSAFFTLDDLPDFNERIRDAKELWVSGLTLNTFFAANYQPVRKFLEDGGKMRVLLAPDNGSAVERANKYLPFEKDGFLSQRGASLARLRALENDFRSMVKWRELKVLPNHFILAINPRMSGGEAQMHLYFFQINTDQGRLLLVREDTDPENFQYICDEFEGLWGSNPTF